jgi:hypothetical protein
MNFTRRGADLVHLLRALAADLVEEKIAAHGGNQRKQQHQPTIRMNIWCILLPGCNRMPCALKES